MKKITSHKNPTAFIICLAVIVCSLLGTNLKAQNQTGQKWSTDGNQSVGGDFLGTKNNEPLLFKTNNLNRFSIDANGNFIMNSFSGMGNGLLSYDNNGKILPFTFNGNSNTFLTGDGTFISTNAIVGQSGWKLDPGNGNVFQTGSGYVGIGTTDPQLKLHVAGDALVEGYVFTQGISIIGRAFGQKLYSDTIDVKLIEMDSLKSINGETRIVGSASVSQKLGVGTKYPEAELDVKGNMALSGEARIDGYIKIPDLASPNKNILYTDGAGIVKPIDIEIFTNGLLAEFHNPVEKQCFDDDGNTPLAIWSSMPGKMYVNPGCTKVGIGTSNPQEMLDIAGNANIGGRLKIGSNSIIIESLGSGTGINNNMYGESNENIYIQPHNKSTGNVGLGLPTSIIPTARLEINEGPRWTTNNWAKALKIGNGHAMEMYGAGTNWGIGASGSRWYMFYTNTETNAGDAAHYVMEARNDGNMYITGNLHVSGNIIGTVSASTTPTYTGLDVCGTIRAKEIIVEANGWCDYVFDENYKLLSIKEKEQFLKKNKHLPSIKSEKTIESEGITVSETIKGLLKETEELTLYIIQLNKRIEELEKLNK